MWNGISNGDSEQRKRGKGKTWPFWVVFANCHGSLDAVKELENPSRLRMVPDPQKRRLRIDHWNTGDNSDVPYILPAGNVIDTREGKPYDALNPRQLGPVFRLDLETNRATNEIYALNVLDAWNFSKVAPKQVHFFTIGIQNGMEEWKEWSLRGRFCDTGSMFSVPFASSEAGNNPDFCPIVYYNDSIFPYQCAREILFMRWYLDAVRSTDAYRRLKMLFREGHNLQFIEEVRRSTPSITRITRESLEAAKKCEDRHFGYCSVLLHFLFTKTNKQTNTESDIWEEFLGGDDSESDF